MKGKTCDSCGMLMMSMDDHAAKNPRSRYCRYCANNEGMLQSPQERLVKLTAFIIEDEKVSEEKAREKAIQQMRKMQGRCSPCTRIQSEFVVPAWKGKV